MSRTLTLASLVLAAACGGGHKPAPATAPTAGEQTHAEHSAEMAEHEGLSPEMTAFHDLLAPRWHAAPGPERIRDTCSAIDQFTAAADAVAKATPPVATNADTWTAGTRALVAAVAGLAKSCANGNAGFDDSFAKVHEAFHALMAQSGPTGDGSGSAGGGMDHDHTH